jgi:histidinol-phosphatase (PHP family)
MPLTTDFHNHISRSSAAQMAASARQKGIHILGLSEHVFQMNEGRPALSHMPLEGPMLATAQYLTTVHAAAQNEKIDVRSGLEVDFIPEKNERIQAALQGYDWDYLIGSIHEIDGVALEQHNFTTQEQGEALWRRYFTMLHEAVKSGYFDVISHPARMRLRNPHEPADIAEEYGRLATVAAQHNVALELNGFDMLVYPDTVKHLARACALHHTSVSVGSDAHVPPQIAQAHPQTEQLLRETGIHAIRIWKQRIAEEYEL